jgi:hypothetical protein
MAEPEFEQVLGALREARSQVTEIAVMVSARLGSDHRLAELGNRAVVKVESVLREIRSAATENRVAPSAAARLHPEHWLSLFQEDLAVEFRAGGGITFEEAERLLKARRENFLKDLEITRRMVRTYPGVFLEGE